MDLQWPRWLHAWAVPAAGTQVPQSGRAPLPGLKRHIRPLWEDGLDPVASVLEETARGMAAVTRKICCDGL